MKAWLSAILSLFAAGAVHAQNLPSASLEAIAPNGFAHSNFSLGPAFGLHSLTEIDDSTFGGALNIDSVYTNNNSVGMRLVANFYTGSGARFSLGGFVPERQISRPFSGEIAMNSTSLKGANIQDFRAQDYRFAPVVAFGVDRTFRNKWGVTADLGAIYTAHYSDLGTRNRAQKSQAYLGSGVSEPHAELGKITILPFVKLGVSFAF